MKALSKISLATILMILMTGVTIFGEPLHKRVNYTISAPFALRMGDYLLPAGKYVLYQISQNNPNLFGLYQEDMMSPPIAILRTVRIDYSVKGWPEKTKLLLTRDEESYGRESVPVLRGWTLPGMDGWEIISVVQGKRGVLVQLH